MWVVGQIHVNSPVTPQLIDHKRNVNFKLPHDPDVGSVSV